MVWLQEIVSQAVEIGNEHCVTYSGWYFTQVDKN